MSRRPPAEDVESSGGHFAIKQPVRDGVLASPGVDAAGIWQGEYRYEPEDGGSPVTFTMTLVQDASNVVSGTVTDGPGGMPEEGRIIGSCRRGRLEFLKLMPVARFAAPAAESTQEMSAYYAAGGHDIEEPIEHPQLIYQGRFTADGRTVTGTWRLDGCWVRLKEGPTFYMPGVRGVWSAARTGA
jgi:hypothetical protein